MQKGMWSRTSHRSEDSQGFLRVQGERHSLLWQARSLGQSVLLRHPTVAREGTGRGAVRRGKHALVTKGYRAVTHLLFYPSAIF